MLTMTFFYHPYDYNPLLYFSEYNNSNNPKVLGIDDDDNDGHTVNSDNNSDTISELSEDEDDNEEESGNKIIEKMNMTRVGGGLQLQIRNQYQKIWRKSNQRRR